MFPTPVNIDRASETLRSEAPSQEVTERAREFIHTHSSSSQTKANARKFSIRPPRARWVALASTAAIAGVLFWPRAGNSGVTWAQTVQKTLDAPSMIETSYLPDGRVAMRIWRSGKKMATLLYSAKGRLVWEHRSDGKRSVNYFDFLGLESPKSMPPNAHEFAAVGDDSNRLSEFELPVQSSDALLHKPGLVVLSHKPASEAGGADEYRIRVPNPYRAGSIIKGERLRVLQDRAEFIVRVDAKLHRIQSLSNANGSGKRLFTYPDSIPDSVFEPHIQTAKDVETYDYKAQNVEVRRRIQQGLGKDGPVTLRLVVLESDGDLWAFWTGALPDRRLTHPMRLPGVPTKDPQTFREFTSDHAGAAGAHPVIAIHQWLGGMAVTPKTKLGDAIDVDIPYAGGVSHFRQVPILRTSMLRFIQEELGASHM